MSPSQAGPESKDRATLQKLTVSKSRGLLGPCAGTAGGVASAGGGKWKVEGGGDCGPAGLSAANIWFQGGSYGGLESLL